MKTKMLSLLALITVLMMVVSACVPAQTGQTGAAPAGESAQGTAGVEEYTTPHPILSDLRVRQAIAHCIDRDALIAAAYPYVEDKAALRMDSFLPKTHWAYKGPYQDYAHDVEAAGALLDEAGWPLSEDSGLRQNANGDALKLTLTTTNAQLRQTWAAVAEQNLAECGILLVRQHVPASWWFGDTTGLARRDFELGAYAWVGESDPKGRTLYACNQIPLPSNNWEGQNSMGWCNEAASNAVIAANNTLVRDERIGSYDIVQQEFGKDMVSLPLFQRAEAEAWGNNLDGLIVDPTEYGSASGAQWKLKDGGDTMVFGMSQEPASMFSLVESAAVQRQIAQLVFGVANTQYSYDFQPADVPGGQAQLSTLENGLAANETVDVKAGDMVYDADGEPVELAQGVNVLIDGEAVEYDGTSTMQLPQLTVTYKLNDYVWQDGTPGSIEDVKLAYQINCDKESGATEFITCESIANVEWAEGLEWTVTYLPGAQPPLYALVAKPFGSYPSHQVLSDGRNLKDVPAAEWATLPEIAEMPLSAGPFMITEWNKGESMTLEANPHYAAGTGVQRIIVTFISDTNQAVAQLINGDVDYLEKATLGGGPEVQTVLDAAAAGKVNVELQASPTWEHIDFNLFTK